MRASLESEKNIISSGVFLLIVGLFKNKLVDDKKKKNGGSISELTILELLLVLKIWSTINLQEREKWKEKSDNWWRTAVLVHLRAKFCIATISEKEFGLRKTTEKISSNLIND
jgi:hypothetical protein